MERTGQSLWMMTALTAVALFGCKGPPPTSTGAIANEPNRLYWGDTHVHTSHSAYAYLLGNRSADPDTAYRWAKGLPVVHPHTGAKVQIHTPLDFLVVADHAEMLGVPLKLMEGDPKLASTETGKRWIRMIQEGKGAQLFEQELLPALHSSTAISSFEGEELEQAAWKGIVEAAERHYAPCSFTTFIGWEWTATPDGKNLHRVVLMNKGREEASQLLPFSSFDSPRPEDLWDWLEETSVRAGTDFIAIPHGSNVSRGMMFAEVDSDGRPITAEYARTRMRWEPIVEVAQIEGDSETHPSLSPDDELADFEKLFHTLEAGGEAEASEADYVRSGLLRGLEIAQEVGANPYEVGMIASTGSHTGLASAEEFNFWGRTAFDSIPENKSVTGPGGLSGRDMSAQGLAAVWAEENTRASIFAALKRREVYATTGPRIRVRFFGGWDFNAKQAQNANMVTLGYTFGHPMGSDLTKAPQKKKPSFLFYAVKDPEGANLDRVQLVKGWVDAEGKAHEKVYDLAWSGGRKRGPDGKIPPIESTVHLATARYQNVWGAPTLRGFWSDPDFDPKERAFYYLRVLEIPTPRHTLYDAVALGRDPNESGRPPTIQERAYTSPIWYTP